jgi:hypothetical protein
LAHAVVGSALPSEEIDRLAAAAPFDGVEALGAVARSGARERTVPARVALGALGRASEACILAGASAAVEKRARDLAEQARARAVDEALAPVREAMAEANSRGLLAEKGAELFGALTAVWSWTFEDEAVERVAVQEVAPVAWEHYRASRWVALRTLLASIEPLVNRLARRIELDPSRVAYAAPCAQILVFRAEVLRDEDDQIATLERALGICPSHRNGRLVLSSTLVSRAIRALSQPGLLSRDRVAAAAEADIARAEKLFPDQRRLDDAKKLLAAVKGSRR